MQKKRDAEAVPRSVQVQLARLFGANSAETRVTTRTDAQWRHTLRSILRELDRYLSENVDTDELHYLMILSGLAAADEALKEKDFWPGYVEGMTRVVLLLIGDYPDHRRRKPGRKKADHYKLDRLRSLHFGQDMNQRVRTLLAAGATGFPKLTRNPRDVLTEFRAEHGYAADYREFLSWYRKTYSQDYAAVFQ